MKIVSWNVNGLRSGFDELTKFIRTENPDVVCLQEIKIAEDDLTEKIKNIPGYLSYWHCAQKRGYSGVAIYSKIKPRNIQIGIGQKKFDDEGRLIGADFGDFKLLNLYFPHSSRDLARLDFKLKFNKEFFNFVKAYDNNLIICGDLNVAHHDIDLARPKDNRKNAGFTPDEREWMDRFLSLDLVDTFRKCHPEVQKFTWWSNRKGVRERNIGWRIDYFLVASSLFGCVEDSLMFTKTLGSDHCPIELKIKL